MNKPGEKFEKLAEILATLRGPNGCPWDKEQTYKDINPYLLEESHEVVEAIDNNDFESLKEELGDLLVHILFHCQLAKEENKFTAVDVINSACEKLIRRHPHVFGGDKAKTTQEVLVNWEKIKQQENKDKRKSILDGLPKTIPALLKAFRLGEKSSRVGFDWEDQKGIWNKVKEEMEELEQALATKNSEQIEQEYGDLLLTLANLARFLKLDPETSLRKACDRFTKRFQWIEETSKQQNQTLQNLTAAQWDELWNKAKTKTQKKS
ncbi:MAG: nucleoside triphosphate pyrophosphohydrolase [Deltaproteobacteria bacterium RIFCSPLOWO2_01_44_7]|nr:MAG: nucleoside triphosphate pyrophosphohydrolase [Deltaproteobacteria bacterium RIFCSPHIGHO2_01_FULL_43_49]OGQ16498.1 MAG: nucleoside triphosphate pyrophosphohydrolase [Deltaproteobacteria bacterium RIFCSPHIGHO2_02_FULL_44_53]OGQ29298.1 MAG: nucleoside triphosphate pyrophosphohydrolase [Deltaproteobacteria bacterium RIFCSPHIGHO2_12_FULL_44_21]OGQ32855.1 MAG: nucleoside triphosphate pyrophosphohydrolase [Deltaproteobacteria bacterium RIFCSPLOWO2_01_FULL_45_74]OGQ38527.1 MAG: nucleoside triph